MCKLKLINSMEFPFDLQLIIELITRIVDLFFVEKEKIHRKLLKYKKSNY